VKRVRQRRASGTKARCAVDLVTPSALHFTVASVNCDCRASSAVEWQSYRRQSGRGRLMDAARNDEDGVCRNPAIMSTHFQLLLF
jgi:hypothetical protein